MSEWEFDGEIAADSSARRVRLVQEWLCLHGINLMIDGDYGPATTEAVREFQRQGSLKATGKVNRTTFEALVGPLDRALQGISTGTRTLGELGVAYARQHLAQSPREIGGQNRGPWVRLYMNGNEGPEWPWCAGFVCFVLRQAAKALDLPMPIRSSFSCDSLAASAKEKGRFLFGSDQGRGRVAPGALFLSRRTSTDWTHTGIVVSADVETLETIEGNTNDAGDREGYEVCRRIRGYEDKDFVLTDTTG